MTLDSSFQVQPIQDIKDGMLVRCSIDGHDSYALTAIDVDRNGRPKPVLIALDHPTKRLHICHVGSKTLAQTFATNWKIEFRTTVLSGANDFQEKAGVILVASQDAGSVCWFDEINNGAKDRGTYFDLTNMTGTNAPALDNYIAVTAWTLWGPAFSVDKSPQWKEIFKFSFEGS